MVSWPKNFHDSFFAKSAKPTPTPSMGSAYLVIFMAIIHPVMVRTDICAENNTNGLLQLHKTGFDKPDYHNGGHGTALDSACYKNTDCHCNQAVCGQCIDGLPQSVPGNFLQRI